MRDVHARFLQQGHDDPFVLGEQGVEQVRVVHHGVAAGARERRGLLHRFGGFDGQSVGSDHSALG